MQQIQEILVQQGIQATDREIEALIAELGANPQQLSDAEVQAIAEELITRKQSTALATAKPKGKVAKSPVKGRKQVKDVTLNEAIVHAASVGNQELDGLTQAIKAGAEQYTAAKTEELINIVRNVPTEVVSTFVERAMGEQADTESFRNVGQQISQGLFGSFTANEAV